jgi:metal-dependent amidase/aminoacylase/carboxypeptidase family protein
MGVRRSRLLGSEELRRPAARAGVSRLSCPITGADEPTAFVATYGQGEPVIGILGEFDALPGLSQAATPDRHPVTTNAPGHGCGHNLLGSELRRTKEQARFLLLAVRFPLDSFQGQ